MFNDETSRLAVGRGEASHGDDGGGVAGRINGIDAVVRRVSGFPLDGDALEGSGPA